MMTPLGRRTRVARKQWVFTLVTLTILLSKPPARAQHATDNWVFGNHAGLNFSSGNPTPFTATTAIVTHEGCASISDQSGQLLFYTDGTTVWDKNNVAMAGVLKGANSSTQSALIVPWPDTSCKKYFVFTVDDTRNSPSDPIKNQKLHYSVVDMSLPAGGALGSITTANTFLKDWVSEKLAAVEDSAGNGVWAVAHGFHEPDPTNGNPSQNREFYAYHVTSSTTATNLPSTLVISSVGTAHQATPASYAASAGQMKISPDGHWIACAVNRGFVEVLNFDASASGAQAGKVTQVTGTPKLFNPSAFGSGANPPNSFYGLEFSPNSSLLYVGTIASFGSLFQIDFLASTPTVTGIPIVHQTSSSNYDFGQLQLASNGTIYAGRDTQPFISVINSPNVAGPGCGFVDHGPNLLAGSNSRLGLPTMIGGNFSCGATCGVIGEAHVTAACDQGSFVYTFTLTNNSAQDIYNVFVSPAAGSTFTIVSPNPIDLSSNPLHPGRSAPLSVTIANAAPGTHICLDLALANSSLAVCCVLSTCVDLPDCPCLTVLDFQESCHHGIYTYNAPVQNLSGNTIQQIFITPISPANINVQPRSFSATVLPNGVATIPVTISGAAPGTRVCIRLSPIGGVPLCCSTEWCITLPPCAGPTPPQQASPKPKK